MLTQLFSLSEWLIVGDYLANACIYCTGGKIFLIKFQALMPALLFYDKKK